MPWWTIHRRKAVTLFHFFCTLAVISLSRFPVHDAEGWHLGKIAPWQKFEFEFRDLLIRHGRRATPDSRFVYLGIDEASMELDDSFEITPAEVAASPALLAMKQSGWPWSRNVYAMIIQRLVDAGARVVALDLLFPTPSRVSENDDAFRAAVDKYADHAVIGSNFPDAPEGNGSGTNGSYAPPSATIIPRKGNLLDSRIGFVNFKPGEDEVVRSAVYRSTALEWNGWPPVSNAPVFESFAARILEKAGAGSDVPADTDEHLLRFMPAEGNEQIHPLSVYKIFIPEFWKRAGYQGDYFTDFFRDKIVIVGPEANWSKDVIPTPLGPIAGSEMHLNAVNAALHHDFLFQPGPAWDAAIIAFMGMAAWVLAVTVQNPLQRICALAAGNALFYGIAQTLYNRSGLYPILLSPLAAMDSSGFLWSAWEQILNQIEKVRMRRTLERYVSKDIVREILDNPASFLHDLVGVRKPVAVLCTDLRDFTGITEQADSHQLVVQLNEYFAEMVRHVFEQNGTLDKFIGDAIMAVWGNLRTEGPASDCELAVRTAIRMQESLVQLNADWQKRGIPPFAMGIGIMHGEAIFGNLGSTKKMEPTVIGDVVNSASRVEGLTKEYGRDILIGESVANLVRDRFRLQLVDHVCLKGKKLPLKVYSVLGSRDDPAAPDEQDYLRLYDEALAAYTGADFAAAAELFRNCLTGRPDDSLVKLYVERSDHLAANPPESWDGVFVMQTK